MLVFQITEKTEVGCEMQMILDLRVVGNLLCEVVITLCIVINFCSD